MLLQKSEHYKKKEKTSTGHSKGGQCEKTQKYNHKQ